MKKMMLSAAALLIGSIAVAQVADPGTATNLSTSGNANAAEVTQGTESYDADYQKARVRQIGLNNSAVIGQNGSAGAVEDGNSADILQIGEDAQAEIAQNGLANLAFVGQDGGGDGLGSNQALINQGQTDAASSGNIGVITQGESGVDDEFFGAEANEAALTQDGTGNAAGITQLFDFNDATVTQTGVNNASTVRQESLDLSTDGLEATVSQTGDLNIAVVDQAHDEGLANGGRSTATTTQIGDANQALQIQRSTAAQGETGETAVINQGVNYASNLAEAIQDQRGAGNYAEINQDGSADGPNAGDPGDYAKQRQVGYNNNALANQDTTNGVGDANFSFQDQAGNDNGSNHDQSGGANYAQSAQYGNNNLVNTDQLGQGNRAHVTQIWSNSVANTSQEGAANFALVHQNEGNSSAVTQHGAHNKAAVFQTRTGYLPENQTDLTFGERYDITITPPTLEPVPHLTTSTSPYDN